MYSIAGMMGRLTGALVVLAVTASCSTPTEPRVASPVAVNRVPDWVTNPGRRYPAAHYLAAVGSGDSRRAAEDNAVAGLARIFESKIDAEETLVEQYRELMGSSGNRFEARSAMDQRVRIRARQELLNVQFGECAIDPMGRAYIIAFMERRPTSAVYAKRIQENEDAVRRFVARADGAGDAAHRYAYRQAAWVVARANQGYLQQLDILETGKSTQRNPGYTVDGLLTAAQEAARALRVAIAVDGDQDGALLAAVTATITGLGFSVVDENAAWQLNASLRVEPVNLARADAQFVRYEYAARVIQGDAIILADTGAGREGHVNLQGARQRAVTRACTDIRTKLKTGLQSHFTRLTQE
jgi:hypothetical protein